jgi:hypothetical protein
LYGKRAKDVYGDRLPPFALQSTGLGSSYAFAHKEHIQEHLSVIEGDKNYGLPRYYQRVLGIDGEKLKMKSAVKEADVWSHYADEGYTYDEYYGLVNEAREQKEKDLLAQEKLMR